jgi:hypothetical protein
MDTQPSMRGPLTLTEDHSGSMTADPQQVTASLQELARARGLNFSMFASNDLPDDPSSEEDRAAILEAPPVEYPEAELTEPTDVEKLTLTLQEQFPGTDGSAWQVGRFLGRAAGFEIVDAGQTCVTDGFNTGVALGFTDLDLFTFTWAFRTGTWDSDQDARGGVGGADVVDGRDHQPGRAAQAVDPAPRRGAGRLAGQHPVLGQVHGGGVLDDEL